MGFLPPCVCRNVKADERSSARCMVRRSRSLEANVTWETWASEGERERETWESEGATTINQSEAGSSGGRKVSTSLFILFYFFIEWNFFWTSFVTWSSHKRERPLFEFKFSYYLFYGSNGAILWELWRKARQKNFKQLSSEKILFLMFAFSFRQVRIKVKNFFSPRIFHGICINFQVFSSKLITMFFVMYEKRKKKYFAWRQVTRREERKLWSAIWVLT